MPWVWPKKKKKQQNKTKTNKQNQTTGNIVNQLYFNKKIFKESLSYDEVIKEYAAKKFSKKVLEVC